MAKLNSGRGVAVLLALCVFAMAVITMLAAPAIGLGLRKLDGVDKVPVFVVGGPYQGANFDSTSAAIFYALYGDDMSARVQTSKKFHVFFHAREYADGLFEALAVNGLDENTASLHYIGVNPRYPMKATGQYEIAKLVEEGFKFDVLSSMPEDPKGMTAVLQAFNDAKKVESTSAMSLDAFKKEYFDGGLDYRTNFEYLLEEQKFTGASSKEAVDRVKKGGFVDLLWSLRNMAVAKVPKVQARQETIMKSLNLSTDTLATLSKKKKDIFNRWTDDIKRVAVLEAVLNEKNIVGKGIAFRDLMTQSSKKDDGNWYTADVDGEKYTAMQNDVKRLTTIGMVDGPKYVDGVLDSFISLTRAYALTDDTNYYYTAAGPILDHVGFGTHALSTRGENDHINTWYLGVPELTVSARGIITDDMWTKAAKLGIAKPKGCESDSSKLVSLVVMPDTFRESMLHVFHDAVNGTPLKPDQISFQSSAVDVVLLYDDPPMGEGSALFFKFVGPPKFFYAIRGTEGARLSDKVMTGLATISGGFSPESPGGVVPLPNVAAMVQRALESQ